jgi:leucyl-tRNA synthetase
MFPYPSGDLHAGHGRNYIMGDVVARLAMMQGKNVLAPMGFDAFGLPAENAAIQNHTHPAEWTEKNIARMRAQFDDWGVGFDWDRGLASCRPDYYKWTQWLFLALYEKGLAYRGKAPVNWCPKDQTVLANEQVVDGACERCGRRHPARARAVVLQITEYAQQLLDDLSLLNGWPEKVRTMQRNWIGRSEGAEVHWKVEGLRKSWSRSRRVSTRSSARRSSSCRLRILGSLLWWRDPSSKPIADLAARVAAQQAEDRFAEVEKEGVDTGLFLLHPLTGARVPLWAANYVVMGYGTVSSSACPRTTRATTSSLANMVCRSRP